MPVYTCATMRVKLKSDKDSKPIVINAEDYDADLHTKVRAKIVTEKEDKEEGKEDKKEDKKEEALKDGNK